MGQEKQKSPFFSEPIDLLGVTLTSYGLRRGVVLADNRAFNKNAGPGSLIMRSNSPSLLASTPAKGVAAAAFLHAVGLAVLAGMHLPIVADAVFIIINTGAVHESIHLTLSESEAATPLVELSLSEQEVLITPDWVEVAGQHFVDLPASEVTLPELEQWASLPSPTTMSNFPLEALSEINLPPSEDVPASESSITENEEPVENVSQPNLSGNRYPSYPDRAQRMGWQGTVVVRLFINEAGRVTDVEIAESSGYELLDSAAVNACRSWRGQPAMRADRPVETIALQPITFRLP